MKMRPMKILDLFCGAGGSAMGYNRAGFDVVGVDNKNQPRYPFKFIKADAVEFLKGGIKGFDAIHASPPCQKHCSLVRGTLDSIEQHEDLIIVVRNLILETGLPYVIENVPAAPLHDPITLCGEMFGLGVIRHRIFESNFDLPKHEHRKHRGAVSGWSHGKWQAGPYFQVYGNGGGKGSLEDWREAMDVWWMETRPEMSQAIPPAYTEYIGSQLMKALSGSENGSSITTPQRAEANCSQCGRRTSPSLASPKSA